MDEKEVNFKITMSNGLFITSKGIDGFYLIQGAKRHHLIKSTWCSLFDQEETIRIKSKEILESIPLGTSMSDDTCLIRDTNDCVYLYSNGTKSYIRNPQDFNLAGFSWNKVKNVEQRVADEIQTVRDFIIETQKEITINPEVMSLDFSLYPNYGILKSFFYEGHEKRRKECHILFPEGKSHEKLPVLYLLHGKGSNGEWTTNSQGQIQKIMGCLIFEKAISDMVIVMPHVMSSESDNDEKKVHDFHYFNRDLELLMAQVNSTYKEIISTKKEDTAIAGISIGGTTALYNGCLFKDRFNYVGGISPNYHLIMCHEREVHTGWLKKKEDFTLGTDKGGFAYLTIGDKDWQYEGHAKYYSNTLNENGINHLFGYAPTGDHNWGTFRRLFYHFMSYDFFRKKAE